MTEWLEVKPHGGVNADTHPRGWIPREFAESIGVDCTPIDRGGAIFFTHEQSDKMRASELWRETL